MDGFFILLGLAALASVVLGPLGFFLALGAGRRLALAETRLQDAEMRLAVAERRAAEFMQAPASGAAERSMGAATPDDVTPDDAASGQAPAQETSPAAPAGDDGADGPETQPTPIAAEATSAQPVSAPHARPGLEERLGARWSVLVGGLALALGALLLVKYSFDAGLFGPGLRVLAGLAFGAALIGAGERLRRRDGAATAQLVSIPAALTAAGTVAIFGALYAAHGLYGFIGPTTAFLLLGATGVAAMLAAALHGPGLAGVGLVGALAAPALVSSANPSPWPLVVYVVIVVAAAQGLARLRRWLWLALAASAGGGLWQALLAFGAVDRFSIFSTAVVHGLAQAAVACAAFVGPLTREPPRDRPDAPATIAPAALAALTLAALTASPANRFGALWIASALALPALLALAGRAAAAAALLAPAAALVLIATMRLWPSVDPRELTPRADRDWALFLRPPVDLGLFAAFGATAALGLSALLFDRLRRGGATTRFAAAIYAATAAAAPLAALALAYARIAGWEVSFPFSAAAGLLAFAFVIVASLFRAAPEEDAAARLGLGFSAAGALAALAMGFVFLLAGGTLTVALSLAALGAAYVGRKLGIGALRWCVAALGIIVAARLAWEPRVVADLGTTPIFNWLLFGYGAPALAFGLAARLVRRETDDTPTRIAQALSLLFAAFLIFFQIRHALNDGDVFTPATRLMEAGLQTFAALAFGVATILIGGRDPSPVYRAATVIAGAVSGVAALVGLLVAANPLFTHDRLAGGVVFNELLVGYGLPAAAAVALAIVARGRRADWFRIAASLVALALVFAYATLETRRIFEGPLIGLRRGASEGEVYAYSAVWLGLGLATLAWGVWRGSREARLGSAVFVLLATLKIFLYDFAGLTGPLRAFSFIGLGVVLIGVGRVYQKLVFTRAAPPPPA